MPLMDTVHVYRDHVGDWRWKRVAPNGRIIADSGEGYRRKGKCLKGLALATSPDYRIRFTEEQS